MDGRIDTKNYSALCLNLCSDGFGGVRVVDAKPLRAVALVILDTVLVYVCDIRNSTVI